LSISPWIPNTGELFGRFKIEIGAQYGDTKIVIPENLKDIRLEGPEDQFYNASSTAEGNIHNNAGGGFEFYAVRGIGFTEIILLCRFVPDAGTRYYRIDNTGDCRINSQGIPEDSENDRLYLDNFFDFDFEQSNEELIDMNPKDKRVLHYRTTKNGRETVFNEFAIRPLENNIRPGDDILLRFSLRDRPEKGIAVADDSDFMAVYDKKMLWRANLYIDEGAKDWNNVHPWNAPFDDSAEAVYPGNDDIIWYGKNEWNKNEDGMRGNGGQVIEIADWTRYHDNNIFQNDNTHVEKAVAYTTCGIDSPFKFNEKMNHQMNILDKFIKEGSHGYTQNSAGWNKTTAPVDKENINASGIEDWNNYYYLGNGEYSEDWTKGMFTCLDGKTYYAYTPGYSAIRNFVLGTYKGDDSSFTNVAHQAAGTDCVCFVQKVCDYSGNQIKLNDFTGRSNDWKTDNTYFNNLEYKTGIYNESNKIMDDKGIFYESQMFDIPIVPGDIIYCFNASGEKKHAMIVDRIKYNDTDENKRRIKRGQIYLIEAASGFNSDYSVIKYQNYWDHYRNNKRDCKDWIYEIKRLK
jgi:hypothetical protein